MIRANGFAVANCVVVLYLACVATVTENTESQRQRSKLLI